MSKLETNTIDTVSGTTTLQIGSTNTNTITLGTSGDTITVPTGATLTVPNGGLSGQNYPAFYVYKNAYQTSTDLTTTKMTWDVVELDTDNAFSSDKFTVPSGKDGKYYIESSLLIQAAAGVDQMARTVSYISKNGTDIVQSFFDLRNSPGVKYSTTVSSILNLSAGDYIEINGFGDTVSGGNVEFRGSVSFIESWFQGYRIGS